MAHTVYVDFTTTIVAAWANDVDTITYGMGSTLGKPLVSTGSGTLPLYQTLGVVGGGTGVTTLTGLVKGNGTSAFSAAVAGTDYAVATTGSSILKADGVGGFTAALGTDVTALIGSNNVTNATNVTGTIASGVTATTQTAGDNSTKVATTAYTDRAASGSHFQSISASVATNALTLTYNGGQLDFRSATATVGIPNISVVIASNSITIPSGATLGTVNNIQARLVILEYYNSGTPVAGVINLAGGNQLDETNLVSPTTISGTSNSSNVFYSSSAVSANSPYRVIGFCDITEVTAGTWATAPVLVQGLGGQALASVSSIGYGQTYQNVAGSRAVGTTYYNTTGKPIFVLASISSTSNSNLQGIVNGVTLTAFFIPAGQASLLPMIVPSGNSYQISVSAGTPGINNWFELR